MTISDADFARAQAQLFEWLSIPSVSADSAFNAETRRAAVWLQDHLNKIGLKAELCETPGHPVVYAEWLEAGKDAPTVLLYGHYDVQPADPLEEWNTKPFEPTVRDGYVYARGSSDDKGQVFAHVVALEHALKAGSLQVNVKLLIEGEEECGSVNLDEFIVGNLGRLACDVVMISDGAMFAPGVPTLTTGLRGLAYLEVHVQGAKSDLHSGGYGGAVANPLNALAIMIGKLKNENGRILVPGVYDKVRAISETELEGWRQLPFNESDLASSVGVTGVGASQAGGEAGFSVLERLWSRPTLDVNGIWGRLSGRGQQNGFARQSWCEDFLAPRAGSRPGRDRRPCRKVPARDQTCRCDARGQGVASWSACGFGHLERGGEGGIAGARTGVSGQEGVVCAWWRHDSSGCNHARTAGRSGAAGGYGATRRWATWTKRTLFARVFPQGHRGCGICTG